MCPGSNVNRSGREAETAALRSLGSVSTATKARLDCISDTNANEQIHRLGTLGCRCEAHDLRLHHQIMRDSGILGCVASAHCDGEYPRILLIMFLADVALSNSD